MGSGRATSVVLSTASSGSPRPIRGWIAGLIYILAQRRPQLVELGVTGENTSNPHRAAGAEVRSAGAPLRATTKADANTFTIRGQKDLEEITITCQRFLAAVGCSAQIKDWHAIRRQLTPKYWFNLSRGGHISGSYAQVYVENDPMSFRRHAEAVLQYQCTVGSAQAYGQTGRELIDELLPAQQRVPPQQAQSMSLALSTVKTQAAACCSDQQVPLEQEFSARCINRSTIDTARETVATQQNADLGKMPESTWYCDEPTAAQISPWIKYDAASCFCAENFISSPTTAVEDRNFLGERCTSKELFDAQFNAENERSRPSDSEGEDWECCDTLDRTHSLGQLIEEKLAPPNADLDALVNSLKADIDKLSSV